MGQEVHRQGLIQGSIREGCAVLVDVKADNFSLAMLRAYMDTNHPTAQMQIAGYYDSLNDLTKMRITFNDEPEALAFHLRYHT